MTTPGAPDLKVDPTQLSKLANDLLNAANAIPNAPEPLVITGQDAISQAIRDKLPAIEDVIQQGLPQVKTDAQGTANNIIAAAEKYLSTDEQLAANYEKHQFDGSGGPAGSGGGGSAGAGGSTGSAGAGGGGAAAPASSGAGAQANSMSQLGQMMSTPMQMAGQAAQVPTQMMGAAASVPQGVMQGVQQISKMAGGDEGSKGEVQPDDQAAAPQQDEHADEKKSQEPSAAAGTAHSERAPANGAAPEHQAPAAPQRPVPQENLPGQKLTSKPEGPIDL